MTPNHDVVQKLLGAAVIQEVHRRADKMGVRDNSLDFLVTVSADDYKALCDIEAQLAGEGRQDTAIDAVTAFKIIESHPEATRYIVETAREGRAYLGDLTVASTSPTNACIRAAKKVIAALNLPDGAGVAFDYLGWRCFVSKPELGEATSWSSNACSGILPHTAIPPWPGDFRESFITLNTQEVSE